MPHMQSLWLGLLAVAATVLIAGGPADAQLSAQPGAARDAAIHKCIAEAHRLYTAVSQDMERSDYYKSCMTQAGFMP